ncbi:ATP-dependent DNA helicase RRM3 [Biomphalaria pfeifferi]|uniref:ATP-dependent DNA helicase RRM3 n=1 Tax=Biomphalaria pfeifferi TaxID=112525 RepID=A0AAD8F9W7_BIOPF|nr:ATP-dependent DNA helicase RRM3 [Biomphalaria pfeifferi]
MSPGSNFAQYIPGYWKPSRKGRILVYGEPFGHEIMKRSSLNDFASETKSSISVNTVEEIDDAVHRIYPQSKPQGIPQHYLVGASIILIRNVKPPKT